MAIQMTGKKTVEQSFTGDGYSNRLGFISLESDVKSLSQGKGRLFMIDKVIDPDTGEMHSRSDGKLQLEASLEQMLTYTFSNGLTGAQVLTCMLEFTDLLRDGTLTDIYGQSDADAGLI